MKKYIVYKVKFPNNKVYIGISSKGLEKRKKSHYKKMESGEGWKFYNALRKYQNKETWEIIDTANCWEALCCLEQIYIKYYDSCNKGYNCTSGGDGMFSPCEETRKKMSLWQKGKKLTKEHRKKLSEAKLGKKYGPRKNGSGNNIAKGLGMKPFKVIDKNTNDIVGIYLSCSECARDLNTYSACISRCLRHPEKYKSYKNYEIKFLKPQEVYHSAL